MKDTCAWDCIYYSQGTEMYFAETLQHFDSIDNEIISVIPHVNINYAVVLLTVGSP